MHDLFFSIAGTLVLPKKIGSHHHDIIILPATTWGTCCVPQQATKTKLHWSVMSPITERQWPGVPMPSSLICPETGTVRYGRYTNPVTINLKDFTLKSAMGSPLPKSLLGLKYKQFMFLGVSDKNFTAGIALADLKYAQQAFFYARPSSGPPWVEVLDIRLFPKISIDPEAEFPDFSFRHSGLQISLQQKRLQASFQDAHLDICLEEGPPPLRLCSRTGPQGWTFTRKASPIKAHGHFSKGRFHQDLHPESCRVLTDRTCGILRKETFWNWAAAASVLPDGREFGMNLAWGVNETGFTENRIWLDGKLAALGPVLFKVPENRYKDPWEIYTEDTTIHLSFYPAGHIAKRFNVGLIATDFVQNTGFFTGHIDLPSLDPLILSSVPGWTEDHYIRW